MKINKQKKGFTIAEVVGITSISAHRLRHWDKIKLVKSIVYPGRGPREARRYTLQDIVCILVIKDLKKNGLSIRKIRESVERIEETTGIKKPLARLRVACLAHAVYFKEKGEFVDPISGQIAIEKALEKISPKLERRRFIPGKRSVEKLNEQYPIKIAAF